MSRRCSRETERFAHGTTVSTNALIQRRGARVGLITTGGFEDTLIIARGPVGRAGGLPQSKAMDFLHTEPPPPLVPKTIHARRHRAGRSPTARCWCRSTRTRRAPRSRSCSRPAPKASRCACSGRSAIPRMSSASARSRARSRRTLPVSLSCEIAPRMGEFERMRHHGGERLHRSGDRALHRQPAGSELGSARTRAAGAGDEVLRQRDAARRGRHQAVSVVNSGPIGGLVAARHLGTAARLRQDHHRRHGRHQLRRRPDRRRRVRGGGTPFLDQGLPVHVPTVKVVTIGAGGGSIAWTDGYRLQVGPQSAGAEPGPACYGRGGMEPTVADALVVLGIIDPDDFFGGRYALDADKARAAIETRIAAAARPRHARSRRRHLRSRHRQDGRPDPQGHGRERPRSARVRAARPMAAPAARIARRSRPSSASQRVIVPYAAPVFSALGVVLSDIAYRHVRSAPVPLDGARRRSRPSTRVFAELAERARADMRASGLDPAQATCATASTCATSGR